MSTAGWKRPSSPPGSMGSLAGALGRTDRRLRDLESGSPLNSASISEGGLTVRDGGDVVIHEGGSFRATWADGSSGALFGPIELDAEPDVTESIGLLVQAAAADDNRDVFRAKTVLTTGSKEVYVGQSDNDGNVDFFGIFSDATAIRGDNSASLRSATGQVVIEAGGPLFLSGSQINAIIRTDTATANLGIAGGDSTSYGELRRITSSLRYKQDVEALDLSHLTADQIIDALQGVTWRDRGMVERDPETTLRIPGHIAEHLHDAGLGAFVVYDEQGRPESISYDRLTGALAQALRTTRDETAQLSATVTAQDKAIADLAARVTALEG